MTKLTYKCKCGEALTIESNASQPVAPELVAWRKLHEDCDKTSRAPSRFVHLHNDVYLQLHNHVSTSEILVRAVHENGTHYLNGILAGFHRPSGVIEIYRGVDVPGILVTPRNRYPRMVENWSSVMEDQHLAGANT